MKAPRRGLRLAKFQLLLFLLVYFLLPDVIADDLFGQTDRADAVPARPEVVAREVPASPQIRPMETDRGAFIRERNVSCFCRHGVDDSAHLCDLCRGETAPL